MASHLPDRYGIHWFRRDLRGVGNLALHHNLKLNDGAVLGIFQLEPGLLRRAHASVDRFSYTLKTLLALKAELAKAGGDLLVVEEDAAEVFGKWLAYVERARLPRPSLVSFGREYEPATRKRDAAVERLLARAGVGVHTECDHLVSEPSTILKDDGSFYKVYSPFARRWFHALHGPTVRARLDLALKTTPRFTLKWSDFPRAGFPFKNQLETLDKSIASRVPLPPAGHGAATSAVQKFRRTVEAYAEERNEPALLGTSSLSIYLRQGAITPHQVLRWLELDRAHFLVKSGGAQFVRELAWREFYQQILFHRPDVERTTFIKRYADLPWSRAPKTFARWCAGQTGFPLVDAAMRQLLTTGWMHNRMRMVVSSFLVKDLLLDYRLGERFFMSRLLDFELASNNGGWQWAASTGVDPQPYFRIFNPWLQARKFDARGIYTRRFVPELAKVDDRALLKPDGDRSRAGYPRPMVSHERQKDRVLEIYRNAPVISPLPTA